MRCVMCGAQSRDNTLNGLKVIVCPSVMTEMKEKVEATKVQQSFHFFDVSGDQCRSAKS